MISKTDGRVSTLRRNAMDPKRNRSAFNSTTVQGLLDECREDSDFAAKGKKFVDVAGSMINGESKIALNAYIPDNKSEATALADFSLCGEVINDDGLDGSTKQMLVGWMLFRMCPDLIH